MYEWIYDFIHYKTTFIGTIVSIPLLLSVSKYFQNLNKAELLKEIRKGMKKDE